MCYKILFGIFDNVILVMFSVGEQFRRDSSENREDFV